MGKGYGLLTTYLQTLNVDKITLHFEELEAIIGQKLPASVNKYAHSFFCNSEKNSYFKYWKVAGFLAKVSPSEKRISFQRTDFSKEEKVGLVKNERKPRAAFGYAFKNVSATEIEREHANVLNSFNYGKEAQIISDVFHKFPSNDDLNIIAMKIAVVDVTNSTQLSKYKSKISLFDLAQIILGVENFDQRVADGDEELVNTIARESKEKFQINLFSFASKYCCYHNLYIYGKDDYSIYDSVLHNHLGEYIEGLTKRELSRCRESFDYQTYNRLIGDFLERNGIDIPLKRRKFDHFVWYKHKDDDKK